MDLKQLEYFVRVAELGSFTRASIALDIAQPALSRQVRLLEVELRQTLLIRNGRGVTTTDAGDLLLEHARGVLHQVERLREELSRARGALVGRVALGLPPSLSRSLTLPLTRAFSSRFPEASLSISEGLSSIMREALITGRLDIALLYNPPPSPDIELAPLLDQPLYLIERRSGLPSEEPATLQELARRDLVIPSRPNAVRMVVERELADVGLRPRIALEIDVITAILDLVADGSGCAVLTRNAVESMADPARYNVRPFTPPLAAHLVLATSSRRPATVAQQSVMALVREIAGQLLQGARGATATNSAPD